MYANQMTNDNRSQKDEEEKKDIKSYLVGTMYANQMTNDNRLQK